MSDSDNKKKTRIKPENGNVIKGLLRGIPVSEGIAIGKAQIMKSPWDEVVSFRLEKHKIDHEIDRYKEALKEVAGQLSDCRDRVNREIGEDEAQIFEAHLYILNDAFFQIQVPDAIQAEELNAECVLKAQFEKWVDSFLRMKSDYFRYRLDDIQDVAMRIVRLLLQTEEVKFPMEDPGILIAHNLVPSDTARIDNEKILGFVTEMGGKTSHASILARSMGLPAVVGIEKLMKRVKTGDQIILDGHAGIVYIDPPQKVVNGYKKRKQQFNAYWKRLAEEASLPAITADGVEISLQANITITADLSLAVKYKADGIGLFRTELPFLIAGRLLTEAEQLKIYRAVVESMKGKSVVIRTLDLGGDKFLPFQEVKEERNPFLGWRSIRISLQERDIFKTQLRAILRASNSGKIKILFPMISSLEEIGEINQVLDETKADLRKEKVAFDESVENGIMIEVPSAAILSDLLIDHTDFFSIGTNDLIQYTLAVDRNNEKVARFYQPLNPAILKLIRSSIQSANRAGKYVSMCGEMAGNPLYTAMLLGFGLRHFSMSPLMLPEVKERIRAVSIPECEEIAADVMRLELTEEIESKLWDFHNKINATQSIPMLEKKAVVGLGTDDNKRTIVRKKT